MAFNTYVGPTGSHRDIQSVNHGPTAMGTSSFSTISVKPHGVYAKLQYPPCEVVSIPSAWTIQVAENQHVNLNSDLVYINHSCEPSLVSRPLFHGSQ